MAVTVELQAPDDVREDERGFTARWTHVADVAPEYEGAQPRKANVVLSVTHHKSGVNHWHGTLHGAYIGASLMNESEEQVDRGDGTTFTMRGVKIDFRTNKAVTVVQEPAPRMNRKRLRAVLDQAIAETQRLYAEQDERVLALWQGVGC